HLTTSPSLLPHTADRPVVGQVSRTPATNCASRRLRTRLLLNSCRPGLHRLLRARGLLSDQKLDERKSSQRKLSAIAPWVKTLVEEAGRPNHPPLPVTILCYQTRCQP